MIFRLVQIDNELWALYGPGLNNASHIGSDRQRMASIGPGVNRAVGCISRD